MGWGVVGGYEATTDRKKKKSPRNANAWRRQIKLQKVFSMWVFGWEGTFLLHCVCVWNPIYTCCVSLTRTTPTLHVYPLSFITCKKTGKRIAYCSAACQKIHWNESHKIDCKKKKRWIMFCGVWTSTTSVHVYRKVYRHPMPPNHHKDWSKIWK